MITLQQDNHDKITVTVSESIIIFELKKYFKWKKDITIKRLQKLGSTDYDKFIDYLSKI